MPTTKKFKTGEVGSLLHKALKDAEIREEVLKTSYLKSLDDNCLMHAFITKIVRMPTCSKEIKKEWKNIRKQLHIK